jgi:hypothetical protein
VGTAGDDGEEVEKLTDRVQFRVKRSEFQRLESVADLAKPDEVAREAMRFGLSYYEKHRSELKEAVKRSRAEQRKRA